MAVYAAVADLVASRRCCFGESDAQVCRERATLEDPVAAGGVTRLDEKRAQRAIAEAVRWEVKVVEYDQGAQGQRGIDRAARRAADHSRRAELLERPDVRS